MPLPFHPAVRQLPSRSDLPGVEALRAQISRSGRPGGRRGCGLVCVCCHGDRGPLSPGAFGRKHCAPSKSQPPSSPRFTGTQDGWHWGEFGIGEVAPISDGETGFQAPQKCTSPHLSGSVTSRSISLSPTHPRATLSMGGPQLQENITRTDGYSYLPV